MTLKDVVFELTKNICSAQYTDYLSTQQHGDSSFYQEGFLQGYNYALLMLLQMSNIDDLTFSSIRDIIEEKKGDK